MSPDEIASLLDALATNIEASQRGHGTTRAAMSGDEALRMIVDALRKAASAAAGA